MFIIENCFLFILFVGFVQFMLICCGGVVLYAVMPVKPLDLKLKEDDATLSLEQPGYLE